MLVWSAVRHRSSVGVRTGTLRGPRGATATIDVELVPAARVSQHRAPGRSPARELPPPGAQLHRPLPLPAGQHLWIPGESTNRLSM